MTQKIIAKMRRRILIILVFFMIFGFVFLTFKLAKIQLVQGEWLYKMASSQQLSDTKIIAQRGTIYDRNMNPLAKSAIVWTVAIEPSYFNTAEKKKLIIENLGEILNEKEKISEVFEKKMTYAVIKKKVETEIKEKIVKFQNDHKIFNGIRFIEDYKRYYPKKNFAAAVLGFTGNDSQGLAGLEAYYEKTLSGSAGRIISAKNARGEDLSVDHEQMIPAKNGYNLRLCLDETVQYFLEKNLEDSIIKNKVKNRAAAIVMDVKTGEILGMAVKNDFDPNEPFKIFNIEEEVKKIEALPKNEQQQAKSEALNRQWRNKAVSDTYYPGSVFKVFIAAMGLELNLINEKYQYLCSGKILPYENARKTIHCHKRNGHGTQNFLEMLCHSCNPGFISLGMKIGATNFFKFYKNFGFHEKTKIDLPGEASDLFFSANGEMKPMDLAVASIGQNFGITPIQMITAVASIANGGKLLTPHIVKEILDENNNIIKSFEPQIKKITISTANANKIKPMLHENVLSGAGINAYAAGYRVAGKTGTSEKIGLSEFGYKDYISSFCGFAPFDEPKIAILVYFDTPRGQYYYGNAVAAPVVSQILQDILPYLGVEKKYSKKEFEKLKIFSDAA